MATSTMKYSTLLILIWAAQHAFGQVQPGQGNEQDTQLTIAPANPNYDGALAEKLGADDFGMKSFYLVILKSGTNTTASADQIAENFRGHMENIRRLSDEGKLVVAGPLGKNDNSYRGIFIFQDIGNLEEAKELLLTDPAIANNLLGYELYNWYGSAALPEYLPFADKIWKKQP